MQPVHEGDTESVLLRLLTILKRGREQYAPDLWRRRLSALAHHALDSGNPGERLSVAR
jgi:hypothetical protein